MPLTRTLPDSPEDPPFSLDDRLSPLVAERLAALMTRQGVPARQQAVVVAELCGISASQARRKLKGAMWSFAEVLAVARRFEASIDELFPSLLGGDVLLPHGSTGAGVAAMQAASFRVASLDLPCQVRLGALAGGATGDRELCAAKAGGQWIVACYGDLPALGVDGACYRAEAVTLIPPAGRSPTRIAVLDDEAGTTEMLCECFADMGYHATAYTSAASFLAESLANHDAFVIDFVLAGGDSSEAVIESIRRAQPEAPLLLLTGKLRDGHASEAALATLLRTANVRFFEKPVRPTVLAAAIENWLDQKAGAAA